MDSLEQKIQAENKRRFDERGERLEAYRIELAAFRAEVDRLTRERDEALREATTLAKAIYEANYRSIAPEWECGDNVSLVLSQISNMLAGINTERDQLREQLAAARNELELARLALSKREPEPLTETRTK